MKFDEAAKRKGLTRNGLQAYENDIKTENETRKDNHYPETLNKLLAGFYDKIK